MQNFLIPTGLIALVVVASAAVQAAAVAEPFESDPAILSKLALERARTRGESRAMAQDAARKPASALDSPVNECGALSIGNVVTGGKPGFQPREVTVVITGDVINANNKCR
jgi:hypothetical protein